MCRNIFIQTKNKLIKYENNEYIIKNDDDALLNYLLDSFNRWFIDGVLVLDDDGYINKNMSFNETININEKINIIKCP
jgi:hypothetical protein